MHKHKYGDYDEMQAGQGFGQSLVVFGQSEETVQPAEAALDHPATWQQNKLFYFRPLDYLKPDSFIESGLRRLLAGITLIGKRCLDRLTCNLQEPDAQARERLMEQPVSSSHHFSRET